MKSGNERKAFPQNQFIVVLFLTLLSVGMTYFALSSASRILIEKSIFSTVSDSLYSFSLLCSGLYLGWTAFYVYKKEDYSSEQIEEHTEINNKASRNSKISIRFLHATGCLLLSTGTAILTDFSLDKLFTSISDNSTLQEVMGGGEQIASTSMNFALLSMMGWTNVEMLGRWKEKIKGKILTLQIISLSLVGISLGITYFYIEHESYFSMM